MSKIESMADAVMERVHDFLNVSANGLSPRGKDSCQNVEDYWKEVYSKKDL